MLHRHPISPQAGQPVPPDASPGTKQRARYHVGRGTVTEHDDGLSGSGRRRGEDIRLRDPTRSRLNAAILTGSAGPYFPPASLRGTRFAECTPNSSALR